MMKCALIFIAVNFLVCQKCKRRTFAIGSHPDAGKTTITEEDIIIRVGPLMSAGASPVHGYPKRYLGLWMDTEQ